MKAPICSFALLFAILFVGFSPMALADTQEQRIEKLEKENTHLLQIIGEMKERLDKLEKESTKKAKDADKTKEKQSEEKESVEEPATKEKKENEEKKDEWYRSLRDEKFRVGGRIQFQYYNIENEQFIQSSRPESPGGTFTMDDVRIYLDGELNNDIKMYGVFDLLDDDSNVVEAYMEFEDLPLNSDVFVGLHKRFFRPGRYTESYPIVGEAFWHKRQMGITWETKHAYLKTYLSLLNGGGLKDRRLGVDKSSEIIGDDTQNFDFNGNKEISAGIELSYDLDTFGEFALMGFVGTGQLDMDDITFLQTEVPGYGFSMDKTKDFAGVNFSYELMKWEFMSQWMGGHDGELDRTGWYAELSRRFKLDNFDYLRSIRPLVRYGEFDVNLTPTILGRRGSTTWDRQQWLLALITEIRKNLTFNVEYMINEEKTGSLYDANNNELLFQLELAF
jgi:hypothetical protein